MNTEKLAAATWFKSSHSDHERECVEVAFLSERQVAMRDSKACDRGALVFAPSAWGTFLKGVDARGVS